MRSSTGKSLAQNPEGDQVRRTAILDAAAELFAETEYHGTSMRMIATRASVSQALIYYHYATKEQLFEAVFERHATDVNKKRRDLLEGFLKDGPAGPGTAVEELVGILVQPWIEVIGDEYRPTREFARFVMRSSYHDDEWSQDLARHHYTDLISLGMAAFRKAVPEFDDDDAFRAYFFSLSMFYMPLSAPERLTVLRGKTTDMTDPAALLKNGTRFAVAGIEAMRTSKLDKSNN
ncbi:TetR/AcrR family transcriptional regulator [Mesorhizobium sp. M7A.F.Ca.US.006.01.1.1]|uniref:TetR/AcrR family transcriptional regulator n=1 Tax=Mesorhizobium sp. M7A.F.Ca.US.006.01.1.1 TaxID=2496707 RepID=UPI0013E3654B|nr:TetR/AcrR family transcriptional regulator [Mesorhizobium sp. M7A.F.Ca.US.006.01.1.1]